MRRMHCVQSRLETTLPFSMTFTFWTLTLQVRRVAFLDQGRLLPNMGPRPQLLHFAMTRILHKQDAGLRASHQVHASV